MIKFFTNFYEWALGRPLPAPETLNYREAIFPNSGIWMLVISGAFMLLYYYVLNNKLIPHRFFHPKYWFLLLVITAITVGCITVYLAQKEGVEHHSYINWLALLNAVYSMIAYSLLSFLFKGKSTAYTSPTPWPSKK